MTEKVSLSLGDIVDPFIHYLVHNSQRISPLRASSVLQITIQT